MSAVIETEGLTKFYGRSRGIWFVDLAVLVGMYFLNALRQLVKERVSGPPRSSTTIAQR